MKSKKEYEKNPSKFLSRPKLPKYKKGKKQNMVVFTKNSCRLKEDGCIHFIKNIIIQQPGFEAYILKSVVFYDMSLN